MKTKKNIESSDCCPLRKPNNLFIAHRGQYVKLLPEEILWVSSEGNYAHIHTAEKQFVNRISLSNLLKLLPTNHFIKIHKCFIIQVAAIDLIDKSSNEVIIKGQTIPIGRSYKTKLLDGLNLIN